MKTKTKEVLTSDKPLSFKVRYFFDYYTKTILIVIAVLLVGGSIIYEATHRAPGPELKVAMVGTTDEVNNVATTLKQASTNPLSKIFFPADEDQVSLTYVNDEDTTGRQKYVLLMATNDLDLVLVDETEYKSLQEQGGLVDLATAKLDLGDLVDSSDPYGIPLAKVVKDLPEAAGNFYLCLITNSDRLENAEKALKTLVD